MRDSEKKGVADGTRETSDSGSKRFEVVQSRSDESSARVEYEG